MRGFSKLSLSLLIIIILAAIMVTAYFIWPLTLTTEKTTVQPPEVGTKTVVLRVVTPPDPNSLPLLLLKNFEKEWLVSDEVNVVIEIKQAPAGDPSAMRALIHSQEADIALFNFLGAAKFHSLGEENIRICGVHVWRGVYILTWENISDWMQLDGARGIAVPGVKTPPHMWAEMVLKKHNVNVDFVGMGPGSALFTLLASPGKNPQVVVAPEPLVSMILLKQKGENWPIKYKVFADTAKEIDPENGVPLGAVNLINPELLSDPVKRKALDLFINNFEKALNCLNKPSTCGMSTGELANILVQGYQKVFGINVPPKLFELITSKHSIGYDYKPASDAKETLLHWLGKFGIKADEKLFSCPI